MQIQAWKCPKCKMLVTYEGDRCPQCGTKRTAKTCDAAPEASRPKGSGGSLVRCNNCGAQQGKGDWERAMDARARAFRSGGFVNLSAPEQCLKCGSTDLVDFSAPSRPSEEPSRKVSDMASRFINVAHQWEEAHAREESAVSMSSDRFRAVLSSTRPAKERAEKEIKRLIGEVRSKKILNDVLRLLQRKGQSGALSLIDAYL